METINKPTTPLPFVAHRIGTSEYPLGTVRFVCEIVGGDNTTIADDVIYAEAAYLAHAANAYPKLVEALHALTHDAPHADRIALINTILAEVGEA